MTQCGIAAIGLDQIVPLDARLKAQIWSWAENEPNNLGGEDCAAQGNDGRFYDVSCSNLYNVACKDPLSDDWYITTDKYSWEDASFACEEEFQGVQFSVPVNGYQNARLKELKSSMGISTVWLNYSDRLDEGSWTSSW